MSYINLCFVSSAIQLRMKQNESKSKNTGNPYLSMKVEVVPEIEIIEEQEEETELEPLYRVLVHNDNVTPMDFVVHVLKTIFYQSNPKAFEIMLIAHITGLAYVQTLPKSEAEKRINKAHFAAGLEGYPLHFSMEPE
jgi:ATP-dependent Clp protease adaptor protein ClpS